MNQDAEYEETAAPELIPESAPNVYDYCRVLMMPIRGYFQGLSAMFEQIEFLFSMHSRIHDDKKASAAMERALK
jgi:hypothetical protein